MSQRILIIQGHPDKSRTRFAHALAAAYADAAHQAGHSVRELAVAELDLPLLRTAEDFHHGPLSPAVQQAQSEIEWASHLLVIYPLWLGSMPALLKGFFEQVFRPGFAFDNASSGPMWKKRLKGRSCRVVVTMGMPALAYRWFFGAHSLKSLERNILGFCGIGPIRESLIGTVEGAPNKRERWLQKMRQYGHHGD